MMNANQQPIKNKYRFIFISILLFVLIDIGVLVPNLILSAQIKEDTIGINLAGRQRMLSQRTVKTLFQIQSAQQTKQDWHPALKELNLVYKLFDDTLMAFYAGGIVTNGNDLTVFLKPVSTDKSINFVNQAVAIWQPYKEKLSPILTAQEQIPSSTLQEVIAYANKHNLDLLKLMNSLTTELEEQANYRASMIQFIQALGILLASCNFLILAFHVMGNLRKNDLELTKANKEINELNNKLTAENQAMHLELQATRQLQQVLFLEQEKNDIPSVSEELSLSQTIVQMQRQLRTAYLSLQERQQASESLNKALHAILTEIHQTMVAAAQGDFSKRLSLNGKQELFLEIANSVNHTLDRNQQMIHELITVFEAVARGDLTHKIQNYYAGSLERLKNNVNTTIDILTQVVTHIQETTVVVNEEMTTLLTNHNSLQQHSETEADVLRQATQLIGEVISLVEGSANSTKQATELALQARELAEQGGTVINTAVQAMEKINYSSQRVADIIGVINAIAFQTNLLALNAAIEAARAGEKGRGFAVVAIEVRNLAQRSASAAGEIRGLIQDSVSSVHSGTELVNQSGETLQAIVTSVRRVSDLINNIVATSHQQVASTHQIRNSIAQLSAMIGKNNELVKCAVKASNNMGEEVEKLADSVAFFH